MKCIFSLIFVAITYESVSAITSRQECERCIAFEECTLFGQLSHEEQAEITAKYACTSNTEENVKKPFGFSSIAKGDYVCCPDTNVWGIEPAKKPESSNKEKNTGNKFDSDNNASYEKNSDYTANRIPWPGLYDNDYTTRVPQFMNYPIYSNPQNQNYLYGNSPVYSSTPRYNMNTPPSYRDAGPQNQMNYELDQQCQNIGIMPPKAESGCCGIQALDEENRSAAPRNDINNRRIANGWNPIQYRRPRWYRRIFKRDVDSSSNVTVDVDSRIAGGKETELEQFPWTALLTVTFDYADGRTKSFSCGSSLISARYVLTAGHCVSEKGARVASIEIILSEYDKRTPGRDCKRDPDGNKKCIENIKMSAEDFVRHPEFDQDTLMNDIALVRLQKNVPYSNTVRPICLPPIDIDEPRYSDLRLAVAGWGRNGPYASNVKQWTVVNLVPQADCISAYPQITRHHLCASGRSGEDTCKGDSGGPLMMLYENKYYVSGIISGKRADVPCGTSGDVPSLYTNVYHYIDWIVRNIRY